MTHLARFPRLRFAHLPTPIEPMDNLSKLLGGPRLWVKRDDCTGLATGGNKTRKLEFLMADAVAQKADVVITQGATQSNHARQTAAIAAKLGIACDILLENRTSSTDRDYTVSGNVLMDRLFGASLTEYPGGTDMNAAMAKRAEELKTKGKRPYIIPGGGSNPVGALGYVACALELLDQANTMGLKLDHVVHATGSTGTQAGLVVGLEAARTGIPVLGISVRAPKEAQEANVYKLVEATADFMGLKGAVAKSAVAANSDYVGAGYGVPTDGMYEAMKLFARTEGLVLDPVYTGKGAAGLIDLVRKGRFKAGENVLFIHTGGQVGMFGYTGPFDRMLAGGNE